MTSKTLVLAIRIRRQLTHASESMGGSVLSYDDDNVGDWLAATTGDRLVLLPAGDTAAAARIWASLGEAEPGDDQGMRAVLDELTAGGLSRTPPFALLAWNPAAPASVHAIVRGSVRVNLQTAAGSVELSGSGVSTWVERSFDDVTRVEVCAGDPAVPTPTSLTLPLQRGMVRTRRLQATFGPASPAVAGAAPAIAAPAQLPVAARIGDPPMPASRPPITPAPPAPLAAPPAGKPATAAAQPASEQTITDIRPAGDDAAQPDAAPALPDAHDGVDAGPGAAPSDGYDHLFGATVMRGVEQAAVRPEAEDDGDEPAVARSAPDSAADDALAQDPEEPGDHDGHTVMSGDIQKLRDSQRRTPSAARAAPALAAQLYLLLPSGTKEPLSQPIRVGRAPSISKVSGDLVPRLVSLGGADQDVSRNHVHFTVEGDTVVVTDLHSRNGTLVVLPGKPPQKLRQGEPTAVIVGTVVDLGSGITITVGQE
jgi:hypothetical protein